MCDNDRGSAWPPGVEGLPAAAFRADPGPLLSPWIQGATKPGRAPTHLWCWYVLVPPKNWIHGYTVGFLNKNCPKKKAVDHSD